MNELEKEFEQFCALLGSNNWKLQRSSGGVFWIVAEEIEGETLQTLGGWCTEKELRERIHFARKATSIIQKGKI